MKQTSKKVGIMTFHMAHNYGAMLQAYALENAVNSLGFSCEILDYRFAYINQWSGIRNFRDFCYESGICKGTLRYAKHLLCGTYAKLDPKRKKFDTFMRKNMTLSYRTYFHPEKLHHATYDAILFGSDQIWNAELTGGFAKEYFGAYFNQKKTKFISYAASCGRSKFLPEWKNTYLPLLKKFHAISTRESTLAEHIQTEYGLQAESVLDPVFLPPKSFWESLANSSKYTINEPYLLIYAFETDDDIYEVAKEIANEKHLNLVILGYKYNNAETDTLQLLDCGPADFVKLIQNATYVCTTSFHGMAFSIIFEKNFFCMGHPLYSERNASLLKLLHLEDRLFFHKKDLTLYNNCDYEYANKILREHKEKSLRFLTQNLS